MFTFKHIELSVYNVNFFIAGLKYDTAFFKKFKFSISGFYVFNLTSSDFSKPDSVTKHLNRYEAALFDDTHSHNKSNIDRLKERYINSTYIL